MKQYQVNRAVKALNRLSSLPLPVRDAYNVFTLGKALEPNYEFVTEQEKKIIQKYGGIIGRDGNISFGDQSNTQEFENEMNELSNMDVEIKFEPVTLSFDALGDSKITPADIMALNGFVNFE